MSTVIATIPVGRSPSAIAIGGRSAAIGARGHHVIQAYVHAYVTNGDDNTVSVIDTATNTVTATIPIAVGAELVAVSPDGTRTYVAFGGGLPVIDNLTKCPRQDSNLRHRL